MSTNSVNQLNADNENICLQSYSANDVVRIALDIGEGLLKNGADVHVVEVAIDKICKTYGAAHVEVFTILSLIIVAIHMPDGQYATLTRRIYNASNHLSRLEMFNALSREICATKPSFSEIDKRILEIKCTRSHSLPLFLIGNMLASGSFAIFFGGTLRDGIAAAIVGIIIGLFDLIKLPFLNKSSKTILTSLAAGILSCILVKISLGENLNEIIIGTIMLLIPGLYLGNAMRDLFGGDTLTGTLKVVQAVITVLLIVLGYAMALLIMGGGV